MYDEYSDKGMKTRERIVEISKAEYLSGYCLRLTFNDKSVQIIDFESFLRHARNPMIRKYLDVKLFQEFSIQYGDLVWHDYDLCFPIADLYEGNIEHVKSQEDVEKITWESRVREIPVHA